MPKMSRSDQKRKTIPPATKQLVLLESGYMCANPRCRHILTLEIHHIIWVRDGGGNEPSNLLALCPNCHALHTREHIPQEAIRTWKGMLIALNSINRNSIDILIYLYRQHNNFFGRHIRYSADTALQLAGLINSGLLEIASATIASE